MKLAPSLKMWIQRFEDPLLFYLHYVSVPKSILHCGSHLGQEVNIYNQYKVIDVWWVEAQDKICKALRSKFGESRIFQGALWEESGLVLDFHITDNGLSSSLFEINSNKWNVRNVSIESVTTITLDETIRAIKGKWKKTPELLILDLQGAELSAIKGGSNEIRGVEHVLVEVSTSSLYKDAATFSMVDAELKRLNFQPLREFISSDTSHGEVVYSKKPLPRDLKLRIICASCLYPVAKQLNLYLGRILHKLRLILDIF